MSARSARYSHTFWHDLPLVPLRDTLLALQWLGAIFGSCVVWRGARMPVINRVAQPRVSPRLACMPDCRVARDRAY
jgi:ceramide glucosyltransferase